MWIRIGYYIDPDPGSRKILCDFGSSSGYGKLKFDDKKWEKFFLFDKNKKPNKNNCFFNFFYSPFKLEDNNNTVFTVFANIWLYTKFLLNLDPDPNPSYGSGWMRAPGSHKMDLCGSGSTLLLGTYLNPFCVVLRWLPVRFASIHYRLVSIRQARVREWLKEKIFSGSDRFGEKTVFKIHTFFSKSVLSTYGYGATSDSHKKTSAKASGWRTNVPWSPGHGERKACQDCTAYGKFCRNNRWLRLYCSTGILQYRVAVTGTGT